MIPFHELQMYARFVGGLPGFLRHPITREDARSAIAHRLATRESAFVRFAQRALFGAARSPYPELMRLAGCDIGDLPGLVRSRGIEGALTTLREAGVYITFEEFKGRTPLVRHGREVGLRGSDFRQTRCSHGRSNERRADRPGWRHA